MKLAGLMQSAVARALICAAALGWSLDVAAATVTIDTTNGTMNGVASGGTFNGTLFKTRSWAE